MVRRLLLVLCFALSTMGCTRLLTRQDSAMPADPQARSTAPDNPDERKTIREKIEERRKERREAEEKEKQKDPPKLPSPFAPKDGNKDTKAPDPKPQTATPSVPPAPTAAAARPEEIEAIRRLYKVAVERFEKLTDFEARLVRQEVVKGIQTPKEELVFQYRKQPLSVYMKGVVEKGKRAREVLYVQGKYENKMYVLIGDADANFLMKSGSVQKFDPDNPLVASRSRKRIYEAGFGDALVRFGKLINATATGERPNAIRYLGEVPRKEYPYPLQGIEATLIPGDDPHLSKGGKKTAFFDMKPESASYGVPVIIITYDHEGREVEYYCFDQFKMPAGLTDADFSPERLGKKTTREASPN